MDDETKTPAPAPDASPDILPAHTVWLTIVSITAVLALVVASIAWYQTQHQNAGTYMCVSSTGQQTAVMNIGNCGPDDIVQWCAEWYTYANGSGECVG